MRGDICPFSGLPKRTCAHCKESPGVRYELRRDIYLGYPIVEVLKNGGQIHRHDEHFRFGVEKARILLAVLHLIRRFAEVGDEIVNIFESDVVVDHTTGQTVTVWVEMHPEFVRSSGDTIERPWLQMQSANARIGVGYEKAKAICALADELKQWAEHPDP